MKHLLTLIAFILFTLLSCKDETPSGSNQHLDLSKKLVSYYWDGLDVFSTSGNPFHQPIDSGYTVHTNSDSMISLLKQSCGPNLDNTYIVAGNFSSPLFIATDTTPVRDIKITLYNIPTNKSHITNVPFVPGSKAADGSDKHYMVINKDKRCLHEFWIFENTKAASGNAISIDSNGIYPNGKSSVASGFSQLQGAIWPKELQDKEINHALFFSCPVTNANGYVPPATSNDGALHNNPYAIPQGTLVRIKPNIDIDTLVGLSSIEKTVYKAIQKYGMYCGDTNGAGIGIKAIDTKSVYTDAYPANFTTRQNGNYYLKNFPFEHLEVVYTGPLTPSKVRPIINSGCINWR
jgi:hypothetical protein